MIGILTTLMAALVILAIAAITPWWLTTGVLIVGGAALLIAGLIEAMAKEIPAHDDENVYEFKKGAP